MVFLIYIRSHLNTPIISQKSSTAIVLSSLLTVQIFQSELICHQFLGIGTHTLYS